MAETIQQAKRAGVKAKPLGGSAIEMDNGEFARLVDQTQHLAALLQAIVDNAGALSDEMQLEIRRALAEGDRSVGRKV